MVMEDRNLLPRTVRQASEKVSVIFIAAAEFRADYKITLP